LREAAGWRVATGCENPQDRDSPPVAKTHGIESRRRGERGRRVESSRRSRDPRDREKPQVARTCGMEIARRLKRTRGTESGHRSEITVG
jgi:hypothetical protein